MIYSPKVAVFGDGDDQLLAALYWASIITAPAVNAGAVRQNEPEKSTLIEATMLERIERVLALAVLHGHTTSIPGAWGCGLFKNDPADIAQWFHMQLHENEQSHCAFRNVVFAVLDRSDERATYSAFKEQFSAVASSP